jgi:hypothetical protein
MIKASFHGKREGGTRSVCLRRSDGRMRAPPAEGGVFAGIGSHKIHPERDPLRDPLKEHVVSG